MGIIKDTFKIKADAASAEIKDLLKDHGNKKIGEVKSFNENFIIPDLKPNQTINGKKEGAWVYWYNAKWKSTNLKDSVAFYRKITFKNDKPIGIVNDFYKSGQKQWEGKLISNEPEINEGKCTWYYENGNKSKHCGFYKIKVTQTYQVE